MARAGRLAGAILAETGGAYFLVGQTKEPCDFPAAGFAPPPRDTGTPPWFARLERVGNPRLPSPRLVLGVEGEAFPRILAERFVIERNGSVSERLWRLVLNHGDADADEEPESDVHAGWLGEIPGPFWKIVRETVLRCL
jgi:hypothetical protein